MAYRTRFAPSPTGLLHLGHAFSAITAYERAREAGGQFLLRIEDIDTTRSRPEFEDAILSDLKWLGLDWEHPVMRQSERFDVYADAVRKLRDLGLVYPCTCTRRDIAAAVAARQEGVDRPPVYPGTCRGRTDAPVDAAWRLNMAAAIDHLGGAAAVAELTWTETGPDCAGCHHLDAEKLLKEHGDIVLARRDIGTSYNVAVVVDDAEQGITEVVRGLDLFEETPVHRLLQALLNLPVPDWHHHRLIRDENGKRLAKRDDARSLASLREAGRTPADVARMLSLDHGF